VIEGTPARKEKKMEFKMTDFGDSYLLKKRDWNRIEKFLKKNNLNIKKTILKLPERRGDDGKGSV